MALIESQLSPTFTSLAIAQGVSNANAPWVVVTPDMSTAQRLVDEVKFFSGDSVPMVQFPDWETLPYDRFSPHQDIVSERLICLYKLPQLKQGLLVLPVNTLMQKVTNKEYVQSNALVLDTGETLNIESFRLHLESLGYLAVPEVTEHGEFAVRGSLIDLYPMGQNYPFRIDLFDNEIESLRTFDPETQRTIQKLEHLEILPAREFPFNDDAIKRFRQGFREAFPAAPLDAPLYQEVSKGLMPTGVEYYLPLFVENTCNLFDFLKKDAVVLQYADVAHSAEQHWQNIKLRFEQWRHDIEHPLLAPEQLWLAPEEIEAQVKNFRHQAVVPQPSAHASFDIQNEDDTSFQNHLSQFKKTLIVAESAGRRELILETLGKHQMNAAPIESWNAFLQQDAGLFITVGDIAEGINNEDAGWSLIAENQLFGNRAAQTRRRKQTDQNFQNLIKNLSDLEPGTPVVHADHGVGRYTGLTKLSIQGVDAEFLTLEYANDDKLYVPVSSLHLISRYTGAETEHAPLNRLGSGQWEKAKRKAREKIRDVAAELLHVYAKREAKKGHAYSVEDTEWTQFSNAFPFEETPDQANAIDAVHDDMTGTQPMDRVVCGDVGFGKTEVAMRAAFIGVQDGKQVAMLVPTTLLAQQHYQNFLDRFADWPIRIECLSRFKTKKEQDATLKQLAEGKLDIVVGTHKLIQPDIKFHNLGLVIIDEEHRFGVRHKEQMKKLRAEVDVLTLTATPIPRTLNMAMSGLRDLSIIATPPAKRLSVKTFVTEWQKGVIRDACLRELQRGGQIYFLHNEVKTIEKITRELQEIVPEAKIQFAHGQMREKELESVMLDFYHHRFNILVATTIIESGIDVPTANTILINRADKLGLAQLHQLRGRVGRSHHRAYAYLIVPHEKSLTSDAKKRLEAISRMEDLGAGFLLANQDLEIRGAGELLGDEQSGHIQEIGFSMYTDMLERAVEAFKNGEMPDLEDDWQSSTEVDLHCAALIPDDYLPDIHTRLVFYKRIAACKDNSELKDLNVEMIDRFGLLPDQIKNLFSVSRLRQKAEKLGIKKVDVTEKGGFIAFSAKPKIDTAKLIELIQQHPVIYKLEGQEKLRFNQALVELPNRIEFIDGLLDKLGA